MGNKTNWVAIIIIILVVAGIAVWAIMFLESPASTEMSGGSPSQTPAVPTIPTSPVASSSLLVPKTWTAEYTSSGFVPAAITIEKGDTVTWVNKESVFVWPASDPHPTHTVYPGFDAKRALATGETYSFTFDKIGTWGYHDHTNSAAKGTVTVTP